MIGKGVSPASTQKKAWNKGIKKSTVKNMEDQSTSSSKLKDRNTQIQVLMDIGFLI